MRRARLATLLLVVGLAVTSGAAEAVQTALVPYLSGVAPGTTGYRFRVVPFGGSAGFEQPGFNDSDFAVGNAAFGTGGFCPLDSTIRTPWPLNDDILLRKHFVVPFGTTPGSVRVAVAIDNDVQVFVNGRDVSGGLLSSENCAVRDRFVFIVPDSALNFGADNVLAVRGRDRGGLSYLDVEVRADVVPVTQLTNVRVLQTISTANIALDPTSFSKPPFAVTSDPVNNRTVVEWRLTSLRIDEIQDLGVDVVLKNPVPGEDRVVSQKVEILYTDVNGQAVRTELGAQSVHVLTSAFTTIVATSKLQYTANEVVAITLAVTNLSEFARTVDATVLIEDSTGAPVATVTTLPAQTFAVGETKTFQIVSFNTGKRPAGAYRVRGQLADAGRAVGQASADFTIVPALQATSSIAPNKLTYASNEVVTLTSRVTSQSPNAVLTHLEAAVTVTDADGLAIFSESKPLADLQPEARLDLKSLTNTGTRPPGVYTASLSVRSDGTPLTNASATFQIVSSLEQARALVGTIGVIPASIFERERTTVTYTLQNIGNDIDLPVIRADILVVDSDTSLAVRVITNEVALNGRETFTESLTFDSTGLAPKTYLVALDGTVAGITQGLGSAALEIKRIPNLAPIANAGPDRLAFVGQSVALDGSGSSDPDGNTLAFHWHLVSVPSTSHLTDSSLIDAATAAPSFVPDAAGTYQLSLVVNDGFVDSQTDTVSVFVNPAPSVDIHPETLNLKSNGGAHSVTGVLRSPVLSAFAFFTAADGATVTATFTLENRYVDKDGTVVTFVIPAENHPGDDTLTPVDVDGDGHADVYQLTLKFNRDLLIAGFRDASGAFRILEPTMFTSTVIGNGLPVGSDTNRAILPAK